MQEHTPLPKMRVAALPNFEATPGETVLDLAASHEKPSTPHCGYCGSQNVVKLRGEVAMRFPGLKNIDMPIVCVFPDILACLDCAMAQFAIPETELRVLAKRESAAG